jgi:transcription-repair coupling factor (superfamily II helicase)
VRSGEAQPQWSPDINLGPPPIIPQDYIPEPDVRLNIYVRLARLANPDEIEAFAEEVEDRFGTPSHEFLDLLAIAEVAILSRELGVARLEGGPNAIALTFRDGRRPAVKVKPGVEWRDERLVVSKPTQIMQERCAFTLDLLRRLKPSG